MSPNEIVRKLTDPELRECVLESLDWRKKGMITGNRLQAVANELMAAGQADESDATRMADSLVIEEAASRFSRQN
jgi:hypothetical protein